MEIEAIRGPKRALKGGNPRLPGIGGPHHGGLVGDDLTRHSRDMQII